MDAWWEAIGKRREPEWRLAVAADQVPADLGLDVSVLHRGPGEWLTAEEAVSPVNPDASFTFGDEFKAFINQVCGSGTD
jgi:hypothetical protein